VAAVAAGLTQAPLPFTGERAPRTLGLAGVSRPGEALDGLTGFLAAHPALWIEALALTAAAVAVPYVVRHGLWGAAVWGAVFLGAALLAPLGAVAAFPTALWVWIATAVLAARVLGTRR
jgi:hypothetical protein